MGIEELDIPLSESRLHEAKAGDSLLLQLRSDRRLGHEWDDWDGQPLPDGGVFRAREALFFQLAGGAGLAAGIMGLAVVWLIGPRLATAWQALPGLLALLVSASAVVWLAWVGSVALVVRTGRNWLPASLAEGGLVPWLMPKLEWLASRIGVSRDRSGNAMMRVFNRLSMARARPGLAPDELLILLPRCLGKEAMRSAMSVSSRYDVPLFVAARGRYARQMIAMRRPRGVVAVACERDLVSGVGDVASRLPVLGTTLQLGDGPCRNTDFSIDELETQVRSMLGLSEEQVPKRPTREESRSEKEEVEASW